MPPTKYVNPTPCRIRLPAWEHTRLPVASKFDTFSVAGIHHKILVAVDAEVVYLTARAATAHTPRNTSLSQYRYAIIGHIIKSR